MLVSVTPDYIRRWEQQTFLAGLSSYELMETAAQAVCAQLKQILGTLVLKKLLFICGPGNNGGDGLAAARLCAQAGAQSEILLLSAPTTADAAENYRRAKEMNLPFYAPEELPDIKAYDAVADAMFGIGFHRRLSMEAEQIILAVNESGCPVLSVDLPSGLNALNGRVETVCIRATKTLTFQCPKHGFYLTDQRECLGELVVQDIGLQDKDRPKETDITDCILVAEESDLPSLLPERKLTAHKGDCGRAMFYMGSMGMVGAAAMAAKACLRAGIGLLTLACADDIMPLLQTLVPQAMCKPTDEAIAAAQFDVVAAGCGLSGNKDALLSRLLKLKSLDKPSVWDAQALNLFAQEGTKLGKNAVITPHIGEAARLLQCDIESVLEDPLGSVIKLHRLYGCNVVLKSATTLLFDGERLALNAVGTPALAKGGSGDLLCGILAALLAQNRGRDMLASMQAASLWLGMAGITAEKEQGVYSVVADDLIACLGKSYLKQI